MPAPLMVKLVSNNPLDFERLGALFFYKNDLLLVWPEARFPFDREQWRERLSLHPGNRSYFVALDGQTIGHVALLETDETRTFAVSYVFIKPQYRGRGLGIQLMTLVELEAKKLGARALRLRVRTYNHHARRVYEAVGFSQSDQTGTLVIMRKQFGSRPRRPDIGSGSIAPRFGAAANHVTTGLASKPPRDQRGGQPRPILISLSNKEADHGPQRSDPIQQSIAPSAME